MSVQSRVPEKWREGNALSAAYLHSNYISEVLATKGHRYTRLSIKFKKAEERVLFGVSVA